MSDRFYGGCRPGVTSVTIYARLSLLSTNGPALGKAAADLTAAYVRTQGAGVAITLSDLAAATSAWSSGGVKEVDQVKHPGLYRLDVPDAAFIAGADEVIITLAGSGLYDFHRAYPLETRRSLRRGVAFPGYTFVMRQSANPGLGATGLTITAQRSLGGAALATMSNAASEISNGSYKIDLSTADLGGDYVTFRFSAPGALDTWASHVLEPAGA